MYIFIMQRACVPIGSKNEKKLKIILTKGALFCIVLNITDAILAQLARARDL